MKITFEMYLKMKKYIYIQLDKNKSSKITRKGSYRGRLKIKIALTSIAS